MKQIFIIISLLFLIYISAPCQRSVTINFQSQKATKLLEEISLQSGLKIFYIAKETDSVLVSVHCKNAVPLALLQSTFINSPLEVTVFEQNIFV